MSPLPKKDTHVKRALKGGDLRFFAPTPLPSWRYQVNLYLLDGTLFFQCLVQNLSEIKTLPDLLTEPCTVLCRKRAENQWFELDPHGDL